MWLIVGLELLTFAIVLVMLAVLRASQPAVFGAGRAALSANTGLALTLLLVTSGALAAAGVHRYRLGHDASARALLIAAAVGGLGFVGLKLKDYAEHIAAGHQLGSNDFWDAFYLGSGFHLAHVLVGLVLLTGLVVRLGRAPRLGVETVAAVALFWHLCDVVWFFLFPFFYVGGG